MDDRRQEGAVFVGRQRELGTFSRGSTAPSQAAAG